MISRAPWTAALATMLALATASCGTGGEPRSSSSESAELDPSALATPSREDANASDVHFLGMMTPHHEQAVTMSDDLLAAEGVSAETRDLARRIRAGQAEEIDVMRQWAEALGEQEAMRFHSTHVANGMLPPEQLDRLGGLDGEQAEETFLRLMREHHEGAMAMTRDAVESAGAESVADLGQHMLDVQTAEVEEMNALLGED